MEPRTREHLKTAARNRDIAYALLDHAARQSVVARATNLRPASASYVNLRDLAFAARYIPGYRLPRAIAEQALRVDLAAVEAAVLTALNIAL